MVNAVGVSIAGFENLAKIGAGGSATVYRAHQTDLDRTVAIKILTSMNDPKVAERFDRECKTMGRLSWHDGIVPIYSNGVTQDGEPYLIMPYYPNGSLQDLIDNEPLDWQTALEHVTTCAKTITTAHENGIYHLDIKPANILLTNDNKPIIADFGISKIANGHQAMRTTGGQFTPVYSAPETFLEKLTGPTSDIYGLGATLWALIAGHPPFLAPDDDPNIMAVINRVTNEPIGNLRHLAPPALCEIIEKATQKNRDQRQQTTAEVYAELNRTFDPTTVRVSTVELHDDEPPFTTTDWATEHSADFEDPLVNADSIDFNPADAGSADLQSADFQSAGFQSIDANSVDSYIAYAPAPSFTEAAGGAQDAVATIFPAEEPTQLANPTPLGYSQPDFEPSSAATFIDRPDPVTSDKTDIKRFAPIAVGVFVCLALLGIGLRLLLSSGGEDASPTGSQTTSETTSNTTENNIQSPPTESARTVAGQNGSTFDDPSATGLTIGETTAAPNTTGTSESSSVSTETSEGSTTVSATTVPTTVPPTTRPTTTARYKTGTSNYDFTKTSTSRQCFPEFDNECFPITVTINCRQVIELYSAPPLKKHLTPKCG